MAALQSMTGFSRAAASADGAALVWEIRSVNGKGLEIRLRLPPGMERIEQAARKVVQKRFSRGNLQATLTLARSGPQTLPIVNEELLKDLAGLAKRLEEQFGCAPARADGLLALPGVLDAPEVSDGDDERATLDTAIVKTLEDGLARLEEARCVEGSALAAALLGHLGEIAALAARVEADPARHPDAVRARLAEQVALLLDAVPALDETRLAQEAAVLATKADISEEIDRLKTHVASGRALIAEGGPAGRKLDFLAQELNRESNTLCAKSNAASITAAGLELKAVVDRFREQVQNLE